MDWLYIIRALWRVIHGRWYVWRDAPTDVVRKVAALSFTIRRKSDVPTYTRELIDQARVEARYRKKFKNHISFYGKFIR